MNLSGFQEQRAKNMIWNAASDYHFLPDYAAYDRNGEPSFYFNCIIGYVHRYYDYALLEDLFLRLGRLREANLYRNLIWLGLEACTYQQAVTDRPLLSTLRHEYAVDVWEHRTSYWDQELFERLNTAHFGTLLGEHVRLSKKESALLKDLEFDVSMDTSQIVRKIHQIMNSYFHCGVPPLHEKRLFPRIPLRIRKAAFHGGAFAMPMEKDSSHQEKSKHRLTLYLPVLYASIRNQQLRKFLELNFGTSIYTPQELSALEHRICVNGHKNCHLHITRGEFRKEAFLHEPPGSFHAALLRQQEKNLRFHREHFDQHMLSISRLTDRIRYVLQCNTNGNPEESRNGQLCPNRVWRGPILHEEKLFFKTIPSSNGDLSIDILLDASASQQNRQEEIASQGYMIAESLTRCGLPVRISSYCSIEGCTVLHIFRDYQETDKNNRIFQYLAAGWNRDSLAIRLAGEQILSSPYEHRLFIILSDCHPNDDHRLFSTEGPIPFFYDYGGERGIIDTAREVSHLRRQNISILAVCTGHEKDLTAARRIYGNDVVWAPSAERFADAVGYLIQQKIQFL